MKITIKIKPQFESHFKEDRFQDSMDRCLYELGRSLKDECSIAWRYDIEVIEMLKEAVNSPIEIGEEEEYNG